jgi:hypothetical protein
VEGGGGERGKRQDIPDPAPVTIARLPCTEKGCVVLGVESGYAVVVAAIVIIPNYSSCFCTLQEHTCVT